MPALRVRWSWPVRLSSFAVMGRDTYRPGRRGHCTEMFWQHDFFSRNICTTPIPVPLLYSSNRTHILALLYMHELYLLNPVIQGYAQHCSRRSLCGIHAQPKYHAPSLSITPRVVGLLAVRGCMHAKLCGLTALRTFCHLNFYCRVIS